MPSLYASQEQTQSAGPSCDDALAGVGKTAPRRLTVASKWQHRLDTRCIFRRAVLTRLQQMTWGKLTVQDRSGAHEFGDLEADLPTAMITVHDRRFYRYVVLGGGIGAAEAFIRGYWDSHDLTFAMQVLARNETVLNQVEHRISRALRPVRSAANWLRRNTRAGSRRNISAHYDLSNEFFSLMLDSTMTYSSGVFPAQDSTLMEASIEKYDRICRKLQISADDHVLEIGTGWGGFAEHAASRYGCRVTTTTISAQQHDYAANRFRKTDLTDRVTLRQDDYRDLQGQFDKLVSIEMIEAVGESFLPGYFAKCSELLKPNGMMALQAITIPDYRYDMYRRSVDFIQRYIFPGGFLPSIGAIAANVGKMTDFCILHLEDFSEHYARTLAQWRDNFWTEIESVKSLGFDRRFIRTWHYYLSYCEAAFRERQVGVAQVTLGKPACR